MLKTTRSSDMSKLEVSNGNIEVIGYGVGASSKELVKKLGKFSTSQKLFKSKKNRQKIRIHLVLALKKPEQFF